MANIFISLARSWTPRSQRVADPSREPGRDVRSGRLWW